MANDFEFAEAFTSLTVRDSQFHSSIRRATFSLQKLQQNLESVARHARRMLLVGGAALAGFVKLASDAEQTGLKFDSVFKEGADSARAWSEALAKAVGRSKFAVQDSLVTFQSFFIGLGFGADQATEMSKRMQTLAIDFASFNNIADSEASQRFISALSGSSEVLDIFGINIKQRALDAELLNQGLAESAVKATEMERALARVAIIAKAMGQQGAIGDAVRTGGSLANTMTALISEAKGLAVEIGTAFIPAMQRAVAVLSRWRDSIQDVIKGNESAVVSITIFVGAMLTIVAVAPKVVGALIAIGGAMALLGGGALAGGLIGVLVLGIGALGAAWATAAIQGKDFGQVVLELADSMDLLSDKTKEALEAAKGDPFVENKQLNARIAAENEASQAAFKARQEAGGRGVRSAESEALATELEQAKGELRVSRRAGEETKRILRLGQANLARKLAELEGTTPGTRAAGMRRIRGEGGQLELNAQLEARVRITDANENIRQQRVTRLQLAFARSRDQDEALAAAKERAAEKADRDREVIKEGLRDEERDRRQRAADAKEMEGRFTEADAIRQLNARREREERLVGAQQDEAATAQARRLQPQRRDDVAQMSVAAVQGFVQRLLTQPPRPEDIERNRLLNQLERGQGELIEVVRGGIVGVNGP